MANNEVFYQDFVTNDGYPFIEALPERIVFNEPIPYTAFNQDYGYPYLKGLPPFLGFNSPYPESYYAQDFVTNDGYPFFDLPKMIDVMSRPVPSIYYKPNTAKKTTHIITIPKQDVFTVTITNHKQTIISNQRKNTMIATGTIKEELQELSQGGSVDLSVRPIIKGSVLNSVGWDVPADELATVYSSTYTSQDFEEESLDIYAINVTPILANGTVLSPSQLESAVHDIVVNGKDIYRIQMGDKFYGETISDAINQAETAAIRIHELHEECISTQPTYSNDENFTTYKIISMIDGVIT